jgi:hypothetical protein
MGARGRHCRGQRWSLDDSDDRALISSSRRQSFARSVSGLQTAGGSQFPATENRDTFAPSTAPTTARTAPTASSAASAGGRNLPPALRQTSINGKKPNRTSLL